MIRLTSLVALLGVSVLTGCGEKEIEEEEEEVIDNDGDGSPEGEDCNDWSGVIYPGAPEVCDDQDNDCDGEIDEDVKRTYYEDGDGDGYAADGSASIEGCEVPSGYAEETGDCDDADVNAHPGFSIDACDTPAEPTDNDCDGDIDEDATYADYYIDADEDGYGADDGKDVINDCAAPEGYAVTNDDCDDTYELTHPDAPERCDSKDNDCNGAVDDYYIEEWYLDADGDGFGDESTETEDCDPPSNYVPDDGLDLFDCDDDDADVSPKGVELCDSKDNDCDDEVDEEACYTKWSGMQYYDQGKYAVPTQRDCEFVFSTAGERSSTYGCPDCLFAFELDLIYDAAATDDNGTCASTTHWNGDLMHGDTTYNYGYTDDLYGYYGPSWMWEYSPGYWYPLSLASPQVRTIEYDESIGYLKYTYGYKDYDYNSIYFTYYHHGEAYLK